MRCRQASSTVATLATGNAASEAPWSGVSMMTSWAPIPFIRS